MLLLLLGMDKPICFMLEMEQADAASGHGVNKMLPLEME